MKQDSTIERNTVQNKQTSKEFFTTDTKTAFEAKALAQWIAFGPVIFQVARVLRNTGILQVIEDNEEGITIEEIISSVSLPRYGVRVLLESALGIGLVTRNDGKYNITKTGHFILHDALTVVNMNFVHDVCYKGLFDLDKSVINGKAEGLKVFGNWETIYEGLSALPADVQKSWFSFDHYFSDTAFPAVLPKVYGQGIKRLLDIGGNTGKWAIASTTFNPDVHITIMDLPGQLSMAREKIKSLKLESRIDFYPANLLDKDQPFPKGYDVIWMSQFLDCFSEKDITSILERCREAITEDGYILILEAFWDRQRFETAAFCLQQTSIYFTALANGTSQMYESTVFRAAVEAAGFEIVEETDNIGLSHTLWKCRKKR